MIEVKYRIACDAKNPSHCIDIRTGKPPVLFRDQTCVVECALFVDSQPVLTSPEETNVGALTLAQGGGHVYDEIVAEANTHFLPPQWERGVGALLTFRFVLLAGVVPPQRLRLELYYNGVVFLDAFVDLIPTASIATTPAVPVAYTQAQADAIFATKTALNTEKARILALESLSPVLFTSQTLTDPQKQTARSNIGAAAVGTTAALSASDLDFTAGIDGWTKTLSADLALTATGTPVAGKTYFLTVQQDAATAGGFNVAWPAGWKFSASGIPAPRPGDVSCYRILRILTPGGDEIRAEPWGMESALPACPAFSFDARTRSRILFGTAPAANELHDVFSAETWAFSTAASGTAGNFLPGGLNNRPCIEMPANGSNAQAGNSGYLLKTAAADLLIDSSLPAGLTVLAVLDSRGTADGRILQLGPCGLGLIQRGGLLEFGSLSNSANRCALPWTAGAGVATAALFVFLPSGGIHGALIPHGGARKVSRDDSATTGGAAGNFEVGQATGGAERWRGRFGRVAVWPFALPWASGQQMLEQACAEFGIVPNA